MNSFDIYQIKDINNIITKYKQEIEDFQEHERKNKIVMGELKKQNIEDTSSRDNGDYKRKFENGLEYRVVYDNYKSCDYFINRRNTNNVVLNIFIIIPKYNLIHYTSIYNYPTIINHLRKQYVHK
jgi:hypothetical protein